MEKFISLEKLKKSYGRHKVLEGVSVSFAPTGLVCLLGESGSGKTTLINTVGGIDTFRGGSVTVGGNKMTGRMDRRTESIRNRNFGYIFQNYYLLSGQTVYENLRLALAPYGLSPDEEKSRIEYLLDSVGMLKYRKRRVSMLSGGQQQRVAIARALIRSPQVIFADEPTGNLDEAATMRVMSILKKVSRSRLVLLATHERRIAEFFADRIISLRDGVITEDREITGKRSYTRTDDTALYLKEYDNSRIGNEKAYMDFYGRPGDSVSLTVVCDRGKVFVRADHGEKLAVIDGSSEARMIDDERPEITDNDAADESFELENIAPVRTGRLTAKQILSMGAASIASMGKRMIMPAVAMLLTAVFSVIAVADFETVRNLDMRSFIQSDSRAVDVTIEKNALISYLAFDETANGIITGISESGINAELWPRFTAEPTYKLDGFYQLGSLSSKFYGYSYMPIDYVDESSLVAGRMPENPLEAVADVWMLQSFMDRKTIMSQSITDYRSFLGDGIVFTGKGITLTIVGICDTGNTSLYIDRFVGLSLGMSGNPVAPLSSLIQAYPEYAGITLGTSESGMPEALVNKHTWDYTTRGENAYSAGNGLHFMATGFYSDDFPFTYVVSDELYEVILNAMVCSTKSFTVLTDDPAAVRQCFKNSETEHDTIRCTVDYDYGDGKASYDRQRSERLSARAVVTGAILLMSLAVLFTAMKYSAVRSAGDIGVYRLLGIGKSSISAVFAVQILITSAFTTLPGSLATAGVLTLLSSVQSLGIEYSITLPALALTVLALTAANLFIGIAPVISLLHMPPARLSAKYDI